MNGTSASSRKLLPPRLEEELIREALVAPQGEADPDELRAALRILAKGMSAPPPGLDRALLMPIRRRMTRDARAEPPPARPPRARPVRPARARFRFTAPGLGLAAAGGLFALALLWSVKPGAGVGEAAGPPAPPQQGLSVRAAGGRVWAAPAATAKGGSGMLLAMGPGVRGALAAGASIQEAGRREATVLEGAAWFWIDPGKGPFAVNTPAGRVNVTGTSFGVRVEGGKVRAEVAEGTVIVQPPAGEMATLSAGRAWDAAPEAAAALTNRPEGAALPDWVAGLVKKDQDAWAEAFVPSMGGQEP